MQIIVFNSDVIIIKSRKLEKRLKNYVYTKFFPKFFKSKTHSKVPLNFLFFDFDTGVFLTGNQRFKECEKIQNAGIYVIVQDAGNY